MCQPEWATGRPDTWSNIIPGGSVRVFLDEISIAGLSKADGTPLCGGPCLLR